ncbi:hypothetical protein NPIL_586021 [Nephila pilipes]|uniref:Uncharacterized protein n=1 Tax=Nephila pilipes TaxID=299642 RepID=A0A8X6P702_NEPPI|nr:hypothetical protein NPIL_586021 [Nephila pilipes]
MVLVETARKLRKSPEKVFSGPSARRKGDGESRLRRSYFGPSLPTARDVADPVVYESQHSQLQITVSAPIYENMCGVLSTLPKADQWDIYGISETG